MKNSEEMFKTIEQVSVLNDSQRERYLIDSWSLNSKVVIGKVTLIGSFWYLADVTDTNGNYLEYPLSDVANIRRLRKTGMFIGPEPPKGINEGQYVTAKYTLSSVDERKKQNNPLVIKVIRNSLEPLKSIPSQFVYLHSDGGVDVEETLYKTFLRDRQYELDLELQQIEKQIKERTQLVNTLETQEFEASKEIESKSNELRGIEERKAELTSELNVQVEQRNQKVEQYEREIDQLYQQVDEMRSRYNFEEKKFRNQADDLRDYVRSKAERLLQLEFITQDQMEGLMPFGQLERDEIKEWPILDNGSNNWSEAIAHIQHYLYGKNIVYPLSLLQNFFALLSTGDLIILSGLSGSGKTNLVKSFAEATGNVAHIIAVKPNWTSAEDLTGYYNPLQRSYLTTPFLDAILAASKDPDHLHIICLDEMNLARVEYYFADFLSALEERKNPTIPLYSDDEAGNVLCEFRLFVEVLLGINDGQEIENLSEFLKRPDVVVQMKKQLGLDDGESMLQLHTRLRRMLSGVLSVPSRLTIPNNVRFVGAVNMDDTTHFLSPKVLDRAHVLQFENPLMYWSKVTTEVDGAELPKTGIRIPAEAFPRRGDYPAFDPASEDALTEVILEWAKQYFTPIGIEIGVRTLRQSIHYKNQLSKVVSIDSVDKIALNNLLRQKLMPRLSFDGTKKPRGRAEVNCASVVDQFYQDVVERLPDLDVFNATRELEGLIDRAKANHNIFNYWS